MNYQISDGGWLVNRLVIPAGTIIDDTQPGWAFVKGIGPPMNAIALDQFTYNYMVSNGQIGKGYPYWAVKAALGLRLITPPIGRVFAPGSGQDTDILGGGVVLG